MTPLGGLSVHQSVSQSVSWMDRCGLLDGSLLIIMDELVAILWMIWSLETWVKADGYCGKKVDDDWEGKHNAHIGLWTFPVGLYNKGKN